MDSSSSIDLAKSILQVFMILLGFGMLARVAAVWIKIPDIVVFLIVGILLGPEVSGLVAIQADSALNQIILIFGACYLLFDGGASLRFSVLKEVWITIVIIATVGVLVTATITGFAAYYILGLPLIVAMLLGAAIASTDPATLVPVFRQVHVRDRVAQMVVSESALNDATGAVTTFAVLAVATGSGEFSASAAFGDFLFQSGVGILAGAVLGYAAAFIIGHQRFDFLSEYAPLVTLMAVMAAFLSADGLRASGFMAVFVFGLMLRNKESFGFAMDSEEGRRLATSLRSSDRSYRGSARCPKSARSSGHLPSARRAFVEHHGACSWPSSRTLPVGSSYAPAARCVARGLALPRSGVGRRAPLRLAGRSQALG